MKKSLLALAAVVALGALPSVSFAQFSGNVSLTTDYRYRGISQTRLKPAVQGGLDYGLPGGFYVGLWASSIKWIEDIPGGSGNVEVDLYGGVKGEISKDLTFDVGVLRYEYPSNDLDPSASTTELYGALTYGVFTGKYSHAVTNTFGNVDSKNSFYVDLSAAFDLGNGFTLTPHVGYQKIKGPNEDAASYTDYALTLSKDFSGFLVSAAIVGTDADKDFYVPGAEANSTKFLGKTGGVLSVKYSF
jgi:uncharacterized protein (TIGR02001 family)